MSGSGGEGYRIRSFAERLASAVPSAGPFASWRRRLRPMFERWIASGGGLRSELPGGEIVQMAAAFRHMTWNPREYAAFRAAVRPGDVILDAGANVGAYTLLFAQWTGAAGRVFAFEPDPDACRGLEQHVALNGLGERITVVRAAITDGASERIPFATFGSSGISRIAARDEAGVVHDVAATSIDRFCDARGVVPSTIKIDVEGAELAALRGARRTIARMPAGGTVFVEMHPQLWPALGISADDIAAECATQGLAIAGLDGSTTEWWETEGVCLRLTRAAPPAP